MLRNVAVLLMFSVVTSFAGACGHPLLDGGWEGTATCNGDDVFPLSAIFNESGDNELDGVIYIEGFIFGGFIAKGVIEGGARDPDDGTYSFKLESDGDEAPDFDVELEYSDDEAEELDGDTDILDEDGAPVDNCPIELERVSVNDD